MKKNTAIIVTIVAWDTILNTGKTGLTDITLRGVGDGSEYTPAASAVQVDATNLPGVYSVSLTEAENNYNSNFLGGISATANIAVFGIEWINEEIDFGETEKTSITAAVPTVLQIQSGLAPASEYDTQLDAAVSSRSSHSAADIWAVGSRTLTSFGTLVADTVTAVWAAVTRTLTAFSFTPSLDVSYDAAKTAAPANEYDTQLDANISTRAPANEYDAPMGRIDQAISTTEGNIRGADSDTLETLSDQIDVAAPSGTGFVSWTYTVTDSVSGNPIDGVAVWVSSDLAGGTVIAGPLTTDAFGIVTFTLNVGTVFLWRTHPGYNFTNPDQEKVVA